MLCVCITVFTDEINTYCINVYPIAPQLEDNHCLRQQPVKLYVTLAMKCALNFTCNTGSEMCIKLNRLDKEKKRAGRRELSVLISQLCQSFLTCSWSCWELLCPTIPSRQPHSSQSGPHPPSTTDLLSSPLQSQRQRK